MTEPFELVSVFEASNIYTGGRTRVKSWWLGGAVE